MSERLTAERVTLEPAKELSLYGAMQALRDGIGTPDTLMAHVKRLLAAAKREAWAEGSQHESEFLMTFGQFCPSNCHVRHNPYEPLNRPGDQIGGEPR